MTAIEVLKSSYTRHPRQKKKQCEFSLSRMGVYDGRQILKNPHGFPFGQKLSKHLHLAIAAYLEFLPSPIRESL
jgi:hypothetical protein